MSVFGVSSSFLAFQSRVQQLTSVLSLFQPNASSSTIQPSLFSGAQAPSSSSSSPQQTLNSQISQLANNELTTLVTQNTNEISTLSQNQTPGVANPNANVIQFFNNQNTLLTGQLTQNTLNANNPFSLLNSTTSALLQLPSFITPGPPPAPPSQSVPFYFLPPSGGNLLSLSA